MRHTRPVAALLLLALAACDDGDIGPPIVAPPPLGPTYDGMLAVTADGSGNFVLYGVDVAGTGRTQRLVGRGAAGVAGLAALHVDADGRLLAIDTNEELLELDRTTGRATSLGPVRPGVVLDMTTRGSVVAHTDDVRDTVETIDLATGATQSFPTGFFDVEAIAWHAALDRYFLCDLVTDQLLSMDPDDGTVTVVGPCDVDQLSYDADTQTLWSRNGTVIRTVDPSTAALGPSFSFSSAGSAGFAFDHTSGLFVGATNSSGTRVLSFSSPGNTASTLRIGLSSVTTHTFLADGTLLAYDSGLGRYVEIDRETGHWTTTALFGAATPPAASSLVYAAATDTIYVTSGTTLHASGAPFTQFTSLGSLGVALNSGLAADATTGALRGAINSQVWAVNLAPTGAALLGSLSGTIEGLAPAPVDTGLAALLSTGVLVAIDPSTGASSSTGLSFGPQVANGVNGLARDPTDGALVTFRRGFVARDDDGSVSAYGSWAAAEVDAIARNPGNGRVYVFGIGSLFEVDAGLGLRRIGPSTSPECASYDSRRGVIAGVLGTSWILISPSTGSFFGDTVSNGALVAIAYDPLLDKHWGVDENLGALVLVDPVAGFYDVVGPLGVADVRGLVLDPVERRLFGVDAATGTPVEIDMSSGLATPTGAPTWVPIDAVWGE
jgi:hypothetical protein